MLNDTIALNAKVRHIDGGRTGTVIGHAKGAKCWLHLVETKAGRAKIQLWLGRGVLVEVAA